MLRLIYIMILSLFFISGCSKENENIAKPQQYSKPLDNSQASRYIENEKAKNIANSILKIPGVNKVVVVVSGKTALIGLDVKRDVNTDNNYKRMAIQKVNEIDGSITKIEVTTDNAMYNRISKLNEDILNGKPLSGAFEEFMGMVRNGK